VRIPKRRLAIASAAAVTLVSLTLAVSATQSVASTTGSDTIARPPTATACMPPFGEGFTSKFAHVNGLWIHYWIGGSGTPLLLIHGYPENGYAWHSVAPVLALTHTVIVPDFRGAGESSKPAEGYTTAALADDLYKVVRSLGYRTVAIAGQDWGGAVAFSYAVAHRGDVISFANIEAGAPAGFGQETAQNANPQLFWFVWLARQDDAESVTVGRERAYLTPLYRDFSEAPSNISPAEVSGYVCSFSQAGAMHAGFSLYRDEFADAKANIVAAREKLEMPVLTIGGADSLGDFAAAERQVAENVTSVVIPNAKHFVLSDNPSATAAALAEFFSN